MKTIYAEETLNTGFGRVSYNMKTKALLHVFGTLWLIGMLTALTPAARADGKESEKSYTGTITSVDTKENTVRVRGYLFSKSFVLGEGCTLALGEKTKATLSDFRLGQRVDICYKNASGVLVA